MAATRCIPQPAWPGVSALSAVTPLPRPGHSRFCLAAGSCPPIGSWCKGTRGRFVQLPETDTSHDRMAGGGQQCLDLASRRQLPDDQGWVVPGCFRGGLQRIAPSFRKAYGVHRTASIDLGEATNPLCRPPYGACRPKTSTLQVLPSPKLLSTPAAVKTPQAW